MAANDLDQKFLEHALEEHRSACKAFFRDLGIVSTVLLAFLFLILFRYIALEDQSRELAKVSDRLHQDQQYLNLLTQRLQAVNGSLAPLSSLLDDTPSLLRGQIEFVVGQQLESGTNQSPVQSGRV